MARRAFLKFKPRMYPEGSGLRELSMRGSDANQFGTVELPDGGLDSVDSVHRQQSDTLLAGQTGAPAPTAATRQAEQNWAGNLRSLAQTQPELLAPLQAQTVHAEWLFGRDGALTALVDGQWWTGCSLPMRVARSILKPLVVHGMPCFLNPTHAAQLQVVLERLGHGQALIAVLPDLSCLALALHCQDFQADIAGHRLWLAAGSTWAEQLQAILEQHPGLPMPDQFIRLPGIQEDLVNQMIPIAQGAITSQRSARASQFQAFRATQDSVCSGQGKLCIVGASQFRLWDDSGHLLGQAMAAGAEADSYYVVDSDNPLSASGLGIAQAAAGCSALVTVDLGRSDLPEVLPTEGRWLTWITRPRVPAYSSLAPHDVLILADQRWRDLARQAGWPDSRLDVAGWPAMPALAEAEAKGNSPSLAIILNTGVLTPSKEVEEMSSHRLLWELITDELGKNPFLLGENLDRYLDERTSQLHIPGQGLNRAVFIQQLILPAYAQGLARALIAEGVPLCLYGRGWDLIEEFRAQWRGPADTRQQFLQAIAGSTALVHVWPTLHAHPIDAVPRPVVRRQGQRRESFIRQAKEAMQGKREPTSPGGAGLSAQIVWRWAAPA